MTDFSINCTAEVKAWSCIATLPYIFMMWYLCFLTPFIYIFYIDEIGELKT
jgi:hypothetical protein